MNGNNEVRPWKRQGKQNTTNYCHGFGSMTKMDWESEIDEVYKD
jgi:hypothetical protein